MIYLHGLSYSLEFSVVFLTFILTFDFLFHFLSIEGKIHSCHYRGGALGLKDLPLLRLNKGLPLYPPIREIILIVNLPFLSL